MDAALQPFHPAVRAWFGARFARPTPAQVATWPEVRAGRHVLLAAPTGSGKTLAAFLVAIDGLAQAGAPQRAGIRVLYVSPLKALDNDLQRNLQEPLRGIAAEARRLGLPLRLPSTAVRTGDTPAAARQQQLRHPADILITTPESLFLLLTGVRARQALSTVETVIVDEIHAVAGTKRGTHLAVSLERLDALAGCPAQRVGLSATQRPLPRIAEFLGGPHPVRIVDATAPRPLELRVTAPGADFRDLPGDSVWDSIAPLVLGDILAHRTTLVFVPDRMRAESLTRQLNTLAGREVCRAHHGSVSREAREEVEAALKAGRLPALCATGTLELGIDVGAIDFVVLVGSPGSAVRGLQRLGRAGHSVEATSAGRLIGRTPLDIAEAAVLARHMTLGLIEATRVPAGALDVLAQQLVSMAVARDWSPAELLRLVRGAWPYRQLSAADCTAVLELLAGRYPAERLAGLRPLLAWDREADVVRARPGAALACALGAGTIPDRGVFPAYGPDGQRVGELDEEFVHESRRGDVFVLGTTAWRIAAITPDRVLVVPGAGPAPRVPFWKGEGPGRPYEVGCALAAFWGEAERHLADEGWWAAAAAECRLEPDAAAVLRRLIGDQSAAGCLPTDRRVVLEWYRDPLGDFRLCVHAPFGRPVTAPWAMALRALLRREGLSADATPTENGILLRLPGTLARDGASGQPPLDLLTRWPAAALEAALRRELPGSALFAARFRECAGRALLLARSGARRRLPLWLQRLQAADLLAAAGRDPAFPLVREALRECLEDHFDLPAWREVLAALGDRLAVVVRQRPGPSPIAAEMEVRFKAAALYRPDGPRAESAAADLASSEEAPAPAYLARAETALAARLWSGARSADELHDRFLRLGLLRPGEVGETALLDALLQAGRVVEAGGGLVAAEELELWRAAAAGEPAAQARFVLRFAAAVPGLSAAEAAARFGFAPDLGALGLEQLPDGRYAHPELRRLVRRRALALARAEAAPVSRAACADFVWRRQRGGDVAAVLGRLQGVFLPLPVWLEQILPAKAEGFRPADLERLIAHGEFLWAGRGAAAAFYRRADYARLAPAPAGAGALLPPGEALWFSDLQVRNGLDGEALSAALRDLAAAGAASNDSLEPLLAEPGPRRRALGGRWSALPPAAPDPAAWAEQLLARYGLVSRELWALAAPPVPWPAGAEALARSGARRGYFVRGLGGIQYARAADLDRLREPGPGAARLLAALDPACLWREAPRRPGGFLCLLQGGPALQISGFGRRVRSLRPLDAEELAAAAALLRDLPAPRGRVEVEQWDGAAILDAPAAAGALAAAGFSRGPATLRWRR